MSWYTTDKELGKCRWNPDDPRDKYCPIFILGDIARAAGLVYTNILKTVWNFHIIFFFLHSCAFISSVYCYNCYLFSYSFKQYCILFAGYTIHILSLPVRIVLLYYTWCDNHRYVMHTVLYLCLEVLIVVENSSHCTRDKSINVQSLPSDADRREVDYCCCTHSGYTSSVPFCGSILNPRLQQSCLWILLVLAGFYSNTSLY